MKISEIRVKIEHMALNLKKGDRLNLLKNDGARLEQLCIGINWGVIVEKSFFGLFSDKKSVDLDASVAVFDEKNILLDLIYFGKKKRNFNGKPMIISDDNAIIHSGDDLTGDKNGNDGIDNDCNKKIDSKDPYCLNFTKTGDKYG